jgi:hypothetical protein
MIPVLVSLLLPWPIGSRIQCYLTRSVDYLGTEDIYEFKSLIFRPEVSAFLVLYSALLVLANLRKVWHFVIPNVQILITY